MDIVTIHDKRAAAILKKKLALISFEAKDRSDLRKLVRDMRLKMREAEGVGLSANQIGLDMKLFVAEVPSEEGRRKFYAMVNPEIIKVGEELNVAEEGCLSIPGMYGPVERKEKITVSGFDLNGKKIKIKAWGFLARVFQHEIDHLNGILISDRAEKLYPLSQSERLKARQK